MSQVTIIVGHKILSNIQKNETEEKVLNKMIIIII